VRQTRKQWLVVGALLAALLVANVIATYNTLTRPYPGHNDFMSRWEGARSYWRDGLNPYGDKASLNIQEQIYGRAANEGEDPGFFAYPFYTLFLVGPLVVVSYACASAIWMVLLEACLIGSLILLFDLYKWRPSPGVLGFLLLWMLFYYYAARGLILGQPGHVVYFLEVLTLWALAKDQDRLAGIALAISTFKPQMGFLLVPFLLLWALGARRWQFIGGFAAAWGVLMLASFALQPSWLGDWIEQIRRYPSYTDFGSPVWIVMQHYLGLGALGEWAVNAALWAIMLWAWAAVLIARRTERFDWAIMITLTITHLSALRTATPHFVVFMIPMVFYFRALDRRRNGSRWIVLILLALLIVPWVQFLLTVDGDFEHPTMYLWLPSGMFALLWVTRRMWWDAGSSIVPGERGSDDRIS
jgi:hypothetical protein